MASYYRADLTSGFNVLGLDGMEISLKMLDRSLQGQPCDDLIESLNSVDAKLDILLPQQLRKHEEERALAERYPSVLERRKKEELRPSKKLTKRQKKYTDIDKMLRECSKAEPSSHKEVFEWLDSRSVAIPFRGPFAGGRTWIRGFEKNPARARTWLSRRWGTLELPPFPRGPKK
jgi:hypothetical protein